MTKQVPEGPHERTVGRLTLHLMTQRDQPYGSRRKCCERCGLMLTGRAGWFWDEHAYTDDEADYRHHTVADARQFGIGLELVPCRP